jgi:hypothetical protein
MTHPHAARSTDPQTSHAAVINRAVRWNSHRAVALRVHYYAANDPAGLTDFECEEMAKELGGLGACAWKRIGELRTEYDPPLIEQVRDSAGNPVSRPGAYNDPRGAYTITADGKRAYLDMVQRKESKKRR